MKLVIVTTAYNCEEWIRQCLVSIKAQAYDNFVCYITDDMSTDDTVEAAKEVIGLDDRFKIINNKEKLYQPGNYDNVIRNNPDIDDEDIIVEVDGDDWLPDNQVFSRVVSYYSDGNTWITYGQFKYMDGRPGFARPLDINQVRTSVFTASHLRTWKAFLWRHIHPEQLKVNGNYAQTAGDMFFMLPMLEMSLNDHAKYVEDINYMYNEDNPLNDHKGPRASSQQELAQVGRSRGRYLPLER
jgi:glycosyltransferase involved in cell wall biosynthesis